MAKEQAQTDAQICSEAPGFLNNPGPLCSTTSAIERGQFLTRRISIDRRTRLLGSLNLA
jgi:hypothetical protein